MPDIDWQLYNSMRGSAEVNKKLTQALKAKIAAAKKDIKKNRRDPLWHARRIRCEMFAVMEKYAIFGAWDSEPSIVLVEEIEKRLGLESNSLSRY
ncbi:hypothetical protein ACFL35_17350 [Candidatus Riflebacteria bacterium]